MSDLRERVAREISIAQGDGEAGLTFGANLDAADRILALFDEERRALLEANRKEQFIAARFEARVKTAEEERDRWMGQYDESEHRGMKWKEEADAARARGAELREALERYGDHDRTCSIHHDVPGVGCNCGFSAALGKEAPRE